jgi:hypothetical protein
MRNQANKPSPNESVLHATGFLHRRPARGRNGFQWQTTAHNNMKFLMKWLLPKADPPENPEADPREGFKFIDRLGLYKHQTKPGYFCGRCKSPVKAHKNGWLCTRCGQLHQDPDRRPPSRK